MSEEHPSPFFYGAPLPLPEIYSFQRSYIICAVHTTRNIKNNERGKNQLANKKMLGDTNYKMLGDTNYTKLL